MEVIESESSVFFRLCQGLGGKLLDLVTEWLLAQGASESAVGVFATELMTLEQVVEATFVCLASSLHGSVEPILVERRFVHTILEIVAILLQVLGIKCASLGIVTNLEALVAYLRKRTAHLVALIQHGILVRVEPSIPFLRKVQVLGECGVRLSQIGRGFVHSSQCCVIAALQWDGLGARVIRNLHIKDEGNLAVDLCGLAKEHVWTNGVGAALNTETSTRLHLPEETNFPVLLWQDPHPKQIAARHQGLVEIMARLPCALGTRELGNRGVHGANIRVLIDTQVHTSSLVVVGISLNLVCLRGPQHARLDGFLDEGNLST